MLRWLCMLALLAFIATASAQPRRSTSEIRAFRELAPCPATGLKRGPCGGWEIDHPIPLCAGGPDHHTNMQWITVADHRWKTFVDRRECRKLRELAARPAR